MNYPELLGKLFQILDRFKQNVIDFLPNLFGAIIIVLLGLLVARITYAIVVRVINKLHFIIPTQSIRSRVTTLLEQKSINKIIGGFLYWIMILIFLTIATEILG